MNRSCIRLAAFALLAMIARAAHAQDDNVKVAASVSSTTTWIGDTISYTIAVEGDAEPKQPTLVAPGFDVEEAGSSRSQSLQIINGRRSETITTDFRFHLRPLREGALQIPPAEVEVGGRTYRTQAIWLEVRRPGQTDNFRVALDPQKTSCYVGEAIPVDVTFYFGARIRNFWPAVAVDQQRATLDPAPGLPPPPRGARQQLEVEVNGQPVTGILGEGRLGGREFTLFTFRMILTPTEPGPLQLGPATIAIDEITGETAPGFFDSPFRDRTRTRRVVIASDPMTLDIKPLPADGRPAGFSGLVGRYTLLTSADRSTANVGDPIQLTLRIRGAEPLRGVEPPPLERPAITEHFRTDPEGWRAAGASTGERQYTTTIRARSAEVTELPPFELPYFDPEAGGYRVARSAPIPLAIEATTVVTAADAEFGPAPAPSSPLRRGLRAGPGGLLANPPAAEALVPRAPALALAQMAPALGIALAVPPALCALMLAARLRADRAGRPSRRAALRAARRRLHAGDDPASAAAAIQTWLAGPLRSDPAAITPDDAQAALAPHDADLAERIGTLLRDCDAARYRPGAIADRSLRDRAGALLRQLARKDLPR